jgi:hypothetical protein
MKQKNFILVNTRGITSLTHFDHSQRNWFHISQLVTIIAIGLRNTYAKSESGAGIVLV